jgi:DNA polymerase-1
LRCMLSPYSSDTGRNQPSSARYVFGQAAWLRRIIQAPPGAVLAYVDYSSQEFAVAAALSGDGGMAADYESGDPYMALAKRAGAVPDDATKGSHPKERAAFKITALAVQYGMQADSLAASLGLGRGQASELIRGHREAYPNFWEWRGAVTDHLQTGGRYETALGWARVAKSKDKATSLGNFPVQAGGGEVLRVAIIALEEAGHRVIAPVHDAVLVEMAEEGHEAELAEIRRIMEEAGKAITGGLTIRTDADLVMPGGHFEDGRGRAMWEAIGGEI